MREGYRRGEPRAAPRSRGRRQRDVARQPRGRGHARRGHSVLLDARGVDALLHARASARGRRRDARQDDDERDAGLGAARDRRRPELHGRRRQPELSAELPCSGAGPWFVAEGDEYDTAFFDKGPKFLHYDPDALLLNAIEFDHADIYRDLDHVKSAFRTLLERLPADGGASRRAPISRRCERSSRRAARGRRSSSATAPGATWRAEDVVDDGTATRFTIVGPDGARCPRRLVAARAPSTSPMRSASSRSRTRWVCRSTASSAALASFSGVKRRQEVIAEGRGITVIDDFAHHPTAVDGTLAALRRAIRTAALGALRAALEHDPPPRLPGRVRGRVRGRGPRHVRGDPSARAVAGGASACSPDGLIAVARRARCRARRPARIPTRSRRWWRVRWRRATSSC